MFDFKLYNYLKNIEKDLKEKYKIKILIINLENDKDKENSISIKLNHIESKDIEEKIISDIINLLKLKNIDYEIGLFAPPNSLQVSDLAADESLINSSTLDFYNLNPKIN